MVHEPVDVEWVGNVGGPVLNWSLASHQTLDVVAQHGEHSQTAV
eukprot:CAMPEP_0174326236 /NCGR_PEP_ID=MMETSP0810-20121108/13778_1 /TAXON_ID=73025 ORGANISM="Eutreptiella gymnastica-like, Strain CCMP1594" /NCGR_SAMPLE_ID=MMETSP0810 /ASSEMBLY_ACC=CAM_ASM_000659 /LENGTH=43 /DNA_ID= /DNA_START= /DNA_END= /DNA_ORIENTATION=